MVYEMSVGNSPFYISNLLSPLGSRIIDLPPIQQGHLDVSN